MGIRGRKRAEVFNPSIAILEDSGLRFNMRVRPVTTKQTVFTFYVIRMYQQQQELCVESFIAQMLETLWTSQHGLRCFTRNSFWEIEVETNETIVGIYCKIIDV